MMDENESFLFTFPAWIAVKRDGDVISVMTNTVQGKSGTGVSIFTDEDIGQRFLKSKESEPAAKAYYLMPIASERELLEYLIRFERLGFVHVTIDPGKRAEYVTIADMRKDLDDFFA
jgi:hypothetical protein